MPPRLKRQGTASLPCVDEVEPGTVPAAPVARILFALSFAHLVNDTLQSLIPAIYPILKTELWLDLEAPDLKSVPP